MKEDKKEERVVAFMPDTSMKEHKKLYKTTYVDNKGNIVTTIHDGNFNPFPPTGPDYLYFEAAEANSTVSLMSTLATAPNLEYSTDGETWQEWQHTTADDTHTFDTITLSAIGDRVYLRGDNPNGLGALPEGADMPLYSHFDMTGKIAAGGNIMSLLDKDAETTEVPEYGFALLFGDFTGENPNTALTAAAAMPNVTAIGEGGCGSMYFGCTSLTAAAAMPALTTIGDNGCGSMYGGCTGLTQAPALPATTLAEYCYNGMFSGCTGLTQAPALPATTLAEGCYDDMFSGCTGLTQAPSLPATTLAEGCYSGMFSGCTGLTQAPALPATTLAEYCYSGMFSGCTFNMSDDGTTFNFDFGPTPPVTVGTTTYNTYYDVAQWMGNTNGFTNP